MNVTDADSIQLISIITTNRAYLEKILQLAS